MRLVAVLVILVFVTMPLASTAQRVVTLDESAYETYAPAIKTLQGLEKPAISTTLARTSITGDALVAITPDGRVSVGAFPFPAQPLDTAQLDAGFGITVMLVGFPSLSAGDQIGLRIADPAGRPVLTLVDEVYSEVNDAGEVYFEGLPWETVGFDVIIGVPGRDFSGNLALDGWHVGKTDACQLARVSTYSAGQGSKGVCGFNVGSLGYIPDNIDKITLAPCAILFGDPSICDPSSLPNPCTVAPPVPGACGQPLPDACDLAEDVPSLCGNPPPEVDECDYLYGAPGFCSNPTTSLDPCDYIRRPVPGACGGPLPEPCDYLGSVPGQCGNPPLEIDECDYIPADTPGLCGQPWPSLDPCDYVDTIPGQCGNPLLEIDECDYIPNYTPGVCGAPMPPTDICTYANQVPIYCAPVNEAPHCDDVANPRVCGYLDLADTLCYHVNADVALCAPIDILCETDCFDPTIYLATVALCLSDDQETCNWNATTCTLTRTCQSPPAHRSAYEDPNSSFRESHCTYYLSAQRSQELDVDHDFALDHIDNWDDLYYVYGGGARGGYLEYGSYCDNSGLGTPHQGDLTTGWSWTSYGPQEWPRYTNRQTIQYNMAYHGSECTHQGPSGYRYQASEFARCTGRHLFSATPAFAAFLFPKIQEDGSQDPKNTWIQGLDYVEINDVSVNQDTCDSWPSWYHLFYDLTSVATIALTPLWTTIPVEGMHVLLHFLARERCYPTNYDETISNELDQSGSGFYFRGQPGHAGTPAWNDQHEIHGVIGIDVRAQYGSNMLFTTGQVNYQYAIGVVEDAYDDFVSGTGSEVGQYKMHEFFVY